MFKYLWHFFAFAGDEGGVVNVLEPHPFYPYLAVSGLDNDVKLFMPVSEDYVDLKPHAKVRTQLNAT